MKTVAILTLVLAGTAVQPALAEAPDAGDGEQAIVVLGNGLPLPPGSPAYGSVAIEADRLRASTSGRIEEVLADVAGFQQFRRSDSRSANPTAQGATLRALGGNASSRALVLLDGVPMADPFFGYIPFSALVPDRLGEARVTRGGGVGAFGAGAVAGTIELASAGREALPLVDVSGFYGSRDATELSATVAPDLGAGFVALSGRWDRGDGFYTTPRALRGAADVRARYESWSASVRGVAPVGDVAEIQARALVFRDDRTLRFAGADSATEGEDASIRFLSRGAWQIDALAYVQARDYRNVTISATSFRPVLDQYSTPSTGYGGKIELRPPVGGGHVLRVGSDLRIASGELFETPISGVTGAVQSRRNAGGRTTTAGFFVEDDWTLGRVVLTAGARADRWTITDGFFAERQTSGARIDRRFADRSGWEGSFRGGVLWRATDSLFLRAAGYTGFRLPTLNELYRPFTVFPVTTNANEALSPEKLEGVEAGLDFAPVDGVRIGLTAFHNRLEGAIANVTTALNTRKRQNVDAIVARGVELTGSARLGAFALSGSYAYDHSKVEASGIAAALDGLDPAQSPRHMASGTLAWAPEGGPRLSTTLRYIGAQYEDDLQANRLPHAVTVDAYASVPVGRGVEIVARGENLLDETILTRKVGTSVDLGTPRTLWIGVRFGAPR